MDFLQQIRQPIEAEMNDFIDIFNESLAHADGLLGQALAHILQQSGKRMRPMLTLLIARNFGQVSQQTQYAAVGLELLHTASLVHDDVVDESKERRGQASVNAIYDNKVAVLVGDFVLSTALLHVSKTNNPQIMEYIARLGQTLSNGEILQLTSNNKQEISEEVYYQVIKQKTAALFETCAAIGALSSGANDEQVAAAKKFGQNVGIIFQIRDDIFDYYDKGEIGKPTGNDMAEGKLTLPIIYALKHSPYDSMMKLAVKVKTGVINPDEIAVLVDFAKQYGGIKYAEQCMWQFHAECQHFIDENVPDPNIRKALVAYLDYVIKRMS